MGLASKLAAAQGGAVAVANYAGQQQQQYQQPQYQQQQQQAGPGAAGGYPGKPNYQAYPGGGQGQQQYPPPNQPPQYGGGGPPPQAGGGGYGPPPGQYSGQPPMSGGGGQQDAAAYERQLEQAIREKRLERFYQPGSPRVRQIAQKAVSEVDRLCQAWRIQKEIANDIVRLALYDVIIYIDDSGSMSFEENGERIKDLQLILQRVAFAATLFDDDGIELRFMNDDEIPVQQLSGIRSEQQIEQLMRNKRYKGLTPFGTKLREKVIDPLVVSKMRSGQMQKPVLIIGITDGQPAGEAQDALIQSVRYAHDHTGNYGPGAISFQFAQVGNDAKATEFLAKLDNDPQIGNMVDCTSNYENESAEMARAQPPVDLTPDLWMIKLILGAIDPSYDTKDEKRNMSGGAPPRPPQGNYGPPQGNFAPPQGGFNQGGFNQGPPQGGYGGNQGYQGGPPQGGFNQGGYQQQGYPPPGQNYPPHQGGGYGQQQQGSGYPPAPQGPPRY